MFTAQLTSRLGAGESFHVTLIDLDDFKEVNDRLGHGMSDALLKAVSRRLHERLHPGDTVARLGGDEFTLLLRGRSDRETAALLTDLTEAVREPLLLDGHDLVARISVGVTSAGPGDTPEELMRRADVAMYTAKSSGGDRWTWFDPIMDQLADADAKLGNDLRQALGRDQDVRALPADRRAAARPARRGRGAGPLAAPGTRSGLPGRVHPAGRAQRHHRRARPVDPARGGAAGRRVGAHVRRTRPGEGEHQHLRTSALIGITDGLRIEAVAEGVETAEQARRLHQVGYQYAQGFHFSRPMSADDIALLLGGLPQPVVGKLDNLH